MWKSEKARRAEKQKGHVQKSCSGNRFFPRVCTAEQVITHMFAAVGRCNFPIIDRGTIRYLVIERKRQLSMFERAINGRIISPTPETGSSFVSFL